MIPAAFLIAALALPPSSIHHVDAPTFEKDAFLKEYQWLHDLLERAYPGQEFLIIPKQYNRINRIPPGWIRIPITWRDHLLYRKKKIKEAA